MLWGLVLVKAEWSHFFQFTAYLFCGGGKFNSLFGPDNTYIHFLDSRGIVVGLYQPQTHFDSFYLLDS